MLPTPPMTATEQMLQMQRGVNTMSLAGNSDGNKKAGCGGIEELISLCPEVTDTINPNEILKILSDEKFKEYALSSTQDMEKGGVREQCADAVSKEQLTIITAESHLFGQGYLNEHQFLQNQESRIADAEKMVKDFSFNPEKDKAERSPQETIIANENVKISAAERELETAKNLLSDTAKSFEGFDASSAETNKVKMDEAKKDATENVKKTTETFKNTTAAKMAAQKAQTAAKPILTKAADTLKKAKENVAAKELADIAAAKAVEDLSTADAAFEVAKANLDAKKNAVKDAEAKLKEATTAQADAKKNETNAKAALTKASAETKKAKGDAVEAAAAAEASSTTALAEASAALTGADAALTKAKQDVTDAKAAEKDADTAFKAATKVQTDAKNAKTKCVDTVTKADAKIAQQGGTLDALTAAAAEAESTMKRTDDEYAAADKADNDAKQAVADAKQAEQVADAALKAATKASVDAKAEVLKRADTLKKLQASVDLIQSKLKTLTGSMALSRAIRKIELLDARNAEKKVKCAEATEKLALLNAKKAELEQQIAASKEEISRLCREARVSEVEKIVNNLKSVRDKLVYELNDAEAQYAIIAKLRKDRISVLGQAEIDRRISIQNKIHSLKIKEKERLDLLPRTCNNCKAVVGDAHATHAHECVQAMKDNTGKIYYVTASKSFKYDGPEYPSICYPSMDGRGFWGTAWEKKSDVEIMKYPFSQDITTNPYSRWWSGFHGSYFVNGKLIERSVNQKTDVPTADAAFAALPNDLKPSPGLAPIASGFQPVFEERNFEGISRDGNRARESYFRDLLQDGGIPQRGDRFKFLMTYHEWYRTIAKKALCKDCGIDPSTLKGDE